MKKRLIQLVWVLCLLTLTCAAVRAAESDEPSNGFRNVSVESAYQQSIELTPLTEKDTDISPSESNYPGAVKMEVVYKAPQVQVDSEYVIFVLTDDSAPSVDNIAYIDQQTGKADTDVIFTVYPKKLPATTVQANYSVWLSSNTDASTGKGITGYAKVASFEYYSTASNVMLGDVSGDGAVGVGDATMILEHVVGIRVLKDREAVAADVSGDSNIGVGDATMILERVVGIRDENFK